MIQHQTRLAAARVDGHMDGWMDGWADGWWVAGQARDGAVYTEVTPGCPV
jgi:hypothetical protein